MTHMDKMISEYKVQDLPLFAEASPDSQQSISEKIKFQAFQTDEALYEYGDLADAVYFIFEGAVKQQNLTPAGKQIHLSYRRAGEYVGVSPANDPIKHVCRAICSEPSIIGILPLGDFQEIFLKDPVLAENLISKLVTFKNEQILIRTGKQILPSFDLVVIDLIRRAEKLKSNHILLPYRTEWAAYLGITPETLSRVITELKKKCPVVLEGDDILIKDVEELKDLLSETLDA